MTALLIAALPWNASAVPEPFQPEVSDPMLAPIAPAAVQVGTGTSQELVVRESQLFQARIEAVLAEAACDW